MKEKIINIKNVLKIIISLFIIFAMIKSCSKAYTFDDIVDYAEQIYDKNLGSENQKNIASLVISKQTYIKQAITTNNLGNYNSIICMWSSGTNGNYYVKIYFFTNPTGLSISTNNIDIGQNNFPMLQFRTYDNGFTYTANQKQEYFTKGYSFGLMELTYAFNNWNRCFTK